MARKSSERLRTLLQLTALRENQAARQLAASVERLQQAQQQSRQLSAYEQEYHQQYVSRGEQSFSRNDLLNYQGFFRQLEHAQSQQVQNINERADEREQARLAWLQLHARNRLLAQLRQRRLAREQLEEEKKLQRELDDRASRRRDRDY